MRETLEHSARNRMSSLNPSPQSSENSAEDGQKECKTQRGWRGHGETRPSKSTRSKHTQTQSVKQHVQALRGSAPDPLHLYVMASGLVFLWIPEYASQRVSDSCAFSWAFFLLFVLSNSNMLAFSYFIISP